MDVDVWYRKLRMAVGTYVLHLHDAEIEAAGQLYCVSPGNQPSGSDDGRVPAPAEDAARWRAATEAVLAALGSVEERDRAARRQLHRPDQAWQGVWWGLRRDRLHRDYEVRKAALEVEVRAAYRAYRAEAGDLTDHIAAWRERWAREERERAERSRAERVAAVREGADGAVWTYRIGDHGGHRRVLIWLPAVERGDGDERGAVVRGLTARQVQKMIEERRGRDPYLWIGWREATGTAMQEWLEDGGGPAGGERLAGDVRAWAALTGVAVEPIVWRPGELEALRASRPSRGYGPSSSYFSPGTFGTSF
ncbi:hypothetical protein AB0J72_51810 [Dactylosporangium sp. NPDC049742]|uniref:hypothetical protein n=1 Tax=Dactylosporangium sp. NPDC049742 TaxID=3154737 RepID=UPI00342F7350